MSDASSYPKLPFAEIGSVLAAGFTRWVEFSLDA